MSSLNSCSFIGNMGKDPEIKSLQNGNKVANLSIACSERWKDKNGEKQERTTWVPVVVWGPLADVCERYLRKGSKVYVCGKFTVRKWQDQSGQDRWSTEIVLQGPQAQLVMLDGKQDGGQREQRQAAQNSGWTGQAPSGAAQDDLDDEIPF